MKQENDDIVLASELAKEIKAQPEPKSFSFGHETLDRAVAGIVPGDFIALGGQAKAGKCFGLGTEIMMADATVKNVEDIKSGDLVMGGDGKAKKVVNTTTGFGDMYRITLRNGDSFICNDEHILVLSRRPVTDNKRGKLRNYEKIYITVKEYLKKSGYFKRTHGMTKVELEFNESQIPIDPYFLGLWLGDGCNSSVGITNIDQEVIDYIYELADREGLRVSELKCKDKAPRYSIVGNNDDGNIQSTLRRMNLLHNKHIPDIYKHNSKEIRLALLAGLIDSDGYSGGKSQIGFCNKNKRLAQDVVWLARSLGMSASSSIKYNKKYDTDYVTVRIGGSNLFDIPLRLKRKFPNIPVSKRKETNIYSFDVEYIGKDTYYGFTISNEIGKGEIVLGDFTLSHNTALCISLTKHFAKNGINVLWFSLELTPREFLKKFDENLENVTPFYVPKKIKEPTMSWLEKKIDEAIEKYDIKFVFLDHIGMIISEKDIAQYNRNSLEVFEERLSMLKHWAVSKEIAILAIFTVTQDTNKKSKRQEPTYADFKGSSRIAHEADLIMFMQRDIGRSSGMTLNETLDWEAEYSTDAKLWIVGCRRTGMMKANIKMFMNKNGDFEEYIF